jgi:hypothetical protein
MGHRANHGLELITRGQKSARSELLFPTQPMLGTSPFGSVGSKCQNELTNWRPVTCRFCLLSETVLQTAQTNPELEFVSPQAPKCCLLSGPTFKPPSTNSWMSACPNPTVLRSGIGGRQIVGCSTPAAAIHLHECLYHVDLRPQVAQITLLSLIIHGDTDRIVPVSAAEWLATEIGISQLIILPGAGHEPTMTQPQAVTHAIDQFFAAHQGDER